MVPDQVNNASKVGRQVNLHWLPASRQIEIFVQRSWFVRVAGDQQQFAAFQDVELAFLGKIIAVPETQGGFVAADQFDSGTDQKGVRSVD